MRNSERAKRPDQSLARARRNWHLILVALICFPVIAAAQVGEAETESTISGRVVFADTGKAVGRASVHLYSSLGLASDRKTPTNVRGEFRFTRVAAGSYFVVADVPEGISPGKAFAITEVGFNSDFKFEHTRVTVDGKEAVRCEVRVVRAGAITGTIVYSDKEPVTAALISLFRRKNGVTTQYFAGPVTTNDRGGYRIDGLPDGEYVIGVADSARGSDFASYPSGLVTAYYPGVASIEEAKGIQVQAGSEASAINITLREDELRQVSGVIKWRDGGKPIAEASLKLRRLDVPEVDVASAFGVTTTNNYTAASEALMFATATEQSTVQANAKGEWKFAELPPGKYLLTASFSTLHKDEPELKPSSEPKIETDLVELDGPSEPMTAREFELTVGDADLNDVVLEISRGTRISGVVIFEESPPPHVSISVNRSGRRLSEFMTDSNNDGTFALEGIPTGDVRVEAAFMSASDLFVKSIMLGSHDLMRKPLRIEDGVEVTGVRITVERGVASLSGQVLLDEAGGPSPNSGVLLVKADPELWQLASARLRVVTNADGEFETQCPPGDYLVFTWASQDQPLQPLDQFIRTHAASARRLSLRNAEEKRIELRVMKPKQ